MHRAGKHCCCSMHRAGKHRCFNAAGWKSLLINAPGWEAPLPDCQELWNDSQLLEPCLCFRNQHRHCWWLFTMFLRLSLCSLVLFRCSSIFYIFPRLLFARSVSLFFVLLPLFLGFCTNFLKFSGSDVRWRYYGKCSSVFYLKIHEIPYTTANPLLKSPLLRPMRFFKRNRRKLRWRYYGQRDLSCRRDHFGRKLAVV